MCLHSLRFEFLTSLWYPDQIKNAIDFLASQVVSIGLCITTDEEESRWIAVFPNVFVAANGDKAHHWFVTTPLTAKFAKSCLFLYYPDMFTFIFPILCFFSFF